MQRDLENGSYVEPTLNQGNPAWPPKQYPLVVGHHDYGNGYESEHEFKLRLLAIRDTKDRSAGSSLGEAIQNNARLNNGTHAENEFIFGDKKYLEPKDLKKIRDLLTSDEYGFKVEFINNSNENEFIKSNLTYHELLTKYDENFLPVGAVMFMSTHDKTACYDLEISYTGNVTMGLKIKKATDKWTKRRVFQPTFKIAKNVIDYGDGPFVTFRDEVMDEKAEVAHPEFYPSFNREFGVSIADYAKAYIASRAPVLLLYGPTGTGKTTFVRTMAKAVNAVVVATSDLKIASSSALIDSYRDLVLKAREDNDPRPYILLLEDLDTLLLSRLNNNREMSRLLNETKGIASNAGFHVIFSTNLQSLKDVDTALIRPGRSFGQIHLDKITIEEAQAVRKVLGYDEFDMSKLAIDGKISLAEAIEEMRVVEEVKSIKDKLLTAKEVPVL